MIPHPLARPWRWSCTDCDAQGEAEADPIFCARCGCCRLESEQDEDPNEGEEE